VPRYASLYSQSDLERLEKMTFDHDVIEKYKDFMEDNSGDEDYFTVAQAYLMEKRVLDQLVDVQQKRSITARPL